MTTDDTDTGATAVADPAAAAQLEQQIAERRAELADLEQQHAAATGSAEPRAGDGTTPDSSDQQAVDAALLERDAEVDPQVGRADPLNTGAHLEGEPADVADVDAQVADTANMPAAEHADGAPSETADVADPAPVVAAPTPPERS